MKRAKRQQMQWSKRGAHLLLQIRIRADAPAAVWYPGLANDDNSPAASQAAAAEVHHKSSCSRMPAAVRRVVGLSLWRPNPDADWLEANASEPALTYLPSRLWLIGLGHLGQAYLWGLGLLPYRDPAELALVLQDIDLITAPTESTSILSQGDMIGQRKTRAMASWAERRGFTASIQEQLFAA
jgi:hypothetical protein